MSQAEPLRPPIIQHQHQQLPNLHHTLRDLLHNSSRPPTIPLPLPPLRQQQSAAHLTSPPNQPGPPGPAVSVSGPVRHPPRRARAVTGDHAQLRAEISRQALLAGEQHPNLPHHPLPLPLESRSPPTSPPATLPAHIMAHRTASIDSTVSSIASAASAQPRPNGINNALRVSQDNAGPQDLAALVQAAGSAEAALSKLFAEKQQAASHNAQLWRLVEKQRAMILGLNKDLEKALKEKERYRRKLKDQLAQSASAPNLITAAGRMGSVDSEDPSPPFSHADPPSDVSRDISVDRRKVSDSSDAFSAIAGRSDTPQDTGITSGTALPATPQSGDSLKSSPRAFEPVTATTTPTARQPPMIEIPTKAPTVSSPPVSPRMIDRMQTPLSANGHQSSLSASSIQAASPQTLSSPKTRKAPPTPLKLNAAKSDPSITNNIMDASDSEYEEDPESARSEFVERGRRKTREDDDREREALVRQEEEQRSRSKKEKKSKSRPSGENGESGAGAVPQPISLDAAPKDMPRDNIRQLPKYDAAVNPAEIIRNRAVSDATGMLQRNLTAPNLLSPGLPMSPRPSDRPPNSPMPRPPFGNTGGVSIPMSPRVGLPLSPRAPRQPIPLPPQTPLAISSPHLDRAKAYHQQAQFQQPVANIADLLKPTPDENGSYTTDRPSVSSENTARSPGEVYSGFVSDEYPGLLLPPNALPSIYVRTASSRMKPSRASFIAPKGGDENPVFTLAVYQRSDGQQLWRLEKTYAAFANLDTQVKTLCTVRERLPEKALFQGHAPVKIDARRTAINNYFEKMMDAVTSEKAAMIVCKFLSTEPLAAEGSDYFEAKELRPDSPITKLRPNMAGYLTKRGKNFGGWKARYFVLDGPSLKYFESQGGAQLGSIKLQNAQIGKQSSNLNPNPFDDEENQYRHAFLVLEPKKKDSQSLVRHVLCAESDDERDAWVEALLKYVDFKDEEDASLAQQAQVSKTGYNAPKAPRAQKSMTDLRPASHHSNSKSIGAVGYSETVAGDAPIMGAPSSPRFAQTPSPPFEKPTAEQPGNSLPAISGPSNLQVIQNTGDWGMKPPPTPSGKDKKRSMFSNLPFTRGRSSSDLAPAEGLKSSPGVNPSAIRGVFGVPLAEAVASAHPDDATTELPAVVYRCIEYLTARNAIAEEGIFRLSGSSTVIKALKDRFNAEGDVNLLSDETYYDVHAVASLLKLYLRELPASILTRDLHLDFLHCLEIQGDEKVYAVNVLVNKLPGPNRALLEALSAFLVMVVDNVGANRMNVRNLGVVFSPTLNLPGPLISLFVEEQQRIFGAPLDATDSPLSTHEPARVAPQPPSDLRSPRKQMFSDLPTPAYNQTQFQQPLGGFHPADDTGMIPVRPSYASYQMAPQGEGGFGSLNDALRSPTVYGTTGTGEPTPREAKARRRESGMLLMNNTMAPQKKPSMTRLREEEGTSF